MEFEPKVGMLATYCINGDRYPMVIVNVLSSNTIEAAKLQNYNETTDKVVENGAEFCTNCNVHLYGRTVYTKRKNGLWIEKGDKMRYWGYVAIGYAESYLDPSF